MLKEKRDVYKTKKVNNPKKKDAVKMYKNDIEIYESVERENPIFNKLINAAWEEIGIDAEFFRDSDYLLVKSEEGEIIGTIEIARYDKGLECKELEAIYDFKRFQNDDIQLLYMDKISIAPAFRGDKMAMLHLLQSMFAHLQVMREDKPQVVLGLLREGFYFYLNRTLDIEIVKLDDPINKEVPIAVDIDANMDKFLSGEWIKFNKKRV